MTALPPTELPNLDDALDARLDEALEESFPASDPVAVHRPERFNAPAHSIRDRWDGGQATVLSGRNGGRDRD